ncbi:MAG TPA: enoyl-CoA hydratase/isomerase family protein [Candidatus Dormibacteraeota bacterium]|nr:enoyl-CoA hydratase/isomerase family protein [Candidatus Dormibacteraeota bacterium]
MGEVSIDIREGVAVLTIDRPHVRNAIGLQTVAELGTILDDLVGEPPKVLVIRGAGDRAFVSGGDLKELALIRDVEGASQMARGVRRLLDRIACFPVPVIAALNGHALGGGAEVAVAADIRVAADDVQIGFTQVGLGIMPAWGGAERLTEIVGRSKALLLIGLGGKLSAAEAERIGLVDVVTGRDDFDTAWRHLAGDFARLPLAASLAVKSSIAAAKPHVHPELEADAVRQFALLWTSDEHWRAAAGASTPLKSL